MSYPSFIARRYILSGKRGGMLSFITFISMAGVALGVATLVITLAVLDGFEREITEKVVTFTSHIQVTGFQNQPLSDPSATLRVMRDSIPGIRHATPFASRECLVRYRDAVDGIFLKGVDPGTDISGVRRFIVEGEYRLTRRPGEASPLVLGRKLSSRLSAVPGSRLTVLSVGGGVGGATRARQFVVSGIYESGMAEYDDVYAFAALEDAQALFQLGDAVTGYEIMASSGDSIEVAAEILQRVLPYPHYARTMFQTYRNLFSWIELQKRPVPIILGGVTLVATVNIIGTLLMMVLEKTREIGVLRALGASTGGIAAIFLRQALVIAVAGTAAGNVLGLAACWAQMEWRFFSLPSDIYFMNTVPILLDPRSNLLVSGISVALCMFCALLPARLAARIAPVTALRFS